MASLGAINKLTGEYIHPFFANKTDEYVCPECNRDLILCKGEKRIHHYRHKTDSAIPCNHYSNPGEAQIHKDAKRLIKSMLERKIPFSIVRKCVSCETSEEFDIPTVDENSKIILEYRFDYNGLKIADVAYIENDEIVCIFEICNTHKTCSEDRPEPWFEIDASTLIEAVSNNNDTVLKIPCIRCEKCDNCKLSNSKSDKCKPSNSKSDIIQNWFSSGIEHQKLNDENKSRAIDIVYNWFNNGKCITPFYFDEENPFLCVEKNIELSYTNETVDLILYEEDSKSEEGRYEKYCIFLVNNLSEIVFKNYYYYSEFDIYVYFISIEWVLSQTEIPNKIEYIASIDNFDIIGKNTYIDCARCKYDSLFWVKRIFTKTDYKIINIITCCGRQESEYAECERCGSLETPLSVRETTNMCKNICKSCDIELYSSGKIYLFVSFSSKDEIKKLGANWDSIYKKWFIYSTNKNKDAILQKWKII
jgi:uncharacterized protein YkuJ